MKARFEENLSLLVIVLVAAVGCTTARRDVPVSTLGTPIKIEFTEPGSSRASIRLESGQMIEPPRCCPPLELRTASGEVVQQFDVTAGQQRLVAPSGVYTLVGHDPAGEECVVQINVTSK
jgi:hypothetical protein